MEPALELRGVAKSYQKGSGPPTKALLPVNMVIAEGEFVTIVGPSGCGKTTLLKVVAGLVDGASGSMRWDGRTGKIPPKDIGMVFQQPALLPWRSIEDNLLLPAQVLGLDKEKSRERGLALLDEVGLAGASKRYPHELSGGMQQRASVARSLVHEPRLLLMDEPFAALDAMTRESLGTMLETLHLQERKTVLFITHSIPEAATLSDRVIVLSPGPGRVVETIEVDIPRPRRLDDPHAAGQLAQIESRIRAAMTSDLGRTEETLGGNSDERGDHDAV